MARRRNKYQVREKQARIRDILLREWDPIAPGFPKPPTEYDSYLGTIYSMLVDERTNHYRIANHLLHIATHSMGLSDGRELRERCSLAATSLMSLRSEFTTH
jgi:hypothetical protein